MKPFKSKIRLAVSALILIVTVVAVSSLATGCSDDKSELEQQIKAKEQEILKLQSDQNQLIGMYNQLESNQVTNQATNTQVAPNYQQEGTYQPAPAQPSTVVVQPSESHSDSALTGGMAGFMLGHALGNLGNNGGSGGGYNSGSRTVINKTIINHTPNTPNITNTKAPSAVRLPPKPTTQINKPTAPISRAVAPVSKPSSFTRSYSSPSKSYSFTRRR